MDQIVLRKFDDMHVHVRDGAMLSHVLPYTTRCCARAVLMPNTNPRLMTAAAINVYKAQVERVLERLTPRPQFKPVYTLYLCDETSTETIDAAHWIGTLAAKAYPRGVTTNSAEGVSDFFGRQFLNVLSAMQGHGMILLLHGELCGDRILVTQREGHFLTVLRQLTKRFPRLKIVLEHVSSKEGVRAVEQLGDNVAATITVHHLLCTLNDYIGSGPRPHYACMPVLKGFDDREALIRAATSGSRKFFLGSDSAPHSIDKKECAQGACGIFSAPVLPETLTQIFEVAGALDKLEDFTSGFGARFYALPRSKGRITLTKKPWRVPERIGNVVPFLAGQELQWQLVE